MIYKSPGSSLVGKVLLIQALVRFFEGDNSLDIAYIEFESTAINLKVLFSRLKHLYLVHYDNLWIFALGLVFSL